MKRVHTMLQHMSVFTDSPTASVATTLGIILDQFQRTPTAEKDVPGLIAIAAAIADIFVTSNISLLSDTRSIVNGPQSLSDILKIPPIRVAMLLHSILNDPETVLKLHHALLDEAHAKCVQENMNRGIVPLSLRKAIASVRSTVPADMRATSTVDTVPTR